MAMTAALPRRVEPELLDDLPASDPRARRSRDDLRRIHRFMGTLGAAQRAMDEASVAAAPRRIVELGAGDGSLMLRLAQARAARWPAVELTLLDRLDLVDGRTRDQFRDLGWLPTALAMDVFEWLEAPQVKRWDITCANLFLHHFATAELARLLAGIAERSQAFFCLEPRRSALPLLASHLVGLLGANDVTRQDAVLSVHAGFRDQELSALWPDHQDWTVREYRAGLFGHGFLAIRKGDSQ